MERLRGYREDLSCGDTFVAASQLWERKIDKEGADRKPNAKPSGHQDRWQVHVLGV